MEEEWEDAGGLRWPLGAIDPRALSESGAGQGWTIAREVEESLRHTEMELAEMDRILSALIPGRSGIRFAD